MHAHLSGSNISPDLRSLSHLHYPMFLIPLNSVMHLTFLSLFWVVCLKILCESTFWCRIPISDSIPILSPVSFCQFHNAPNLLPRLNPHNLIHGGFWIKSWIPQLFVPSVLFSYLSSHLLSPTPPPPWPLLTPPSLLFSLVAISHYRNNRMCKSQHNESTIIVIASKGARLRQFSADEKLSIYR